MSKSAEAGAVPGPHEVAVTRRSSSQGAGGRDYLGRSRSLPARYAMCLHDQFSPVQHGPLAVGVVVARRALPRWATSQGRLSCGSCGTPTRWCRAPTPRVLLPAGHEPVRAFVASTGRRSLDQRTTSRAGDPVGRAVG